MEGSRDLPSAFCHEQMPSAPCSELHNHVLHDCDTAPVLPIPTTAAIQTTLALTRDWVCAYASACSHCARSGEFESVRGN